MGLFNGIKTIFGNNAQQGQNTPNTENVPNLQEKKVLIVEDEALLANALEIKLKNGGFVVLKAENGQVGLDSAIANKPDLILLDLLMPVMDGKTMLHNLRKLPEFKNLPVIILTNAGDVDNIRQTKTFDNASSFLIKSNVNPDNILTEVKNLIH